jgi:ubiquinone/menaquinone biosynthesis C-methylase UbiE
VQIRTRPAAQELMDDPACAEGELRLALRDLGRINRVFGAHRFVRAYLDRAIPAAGHRRPGAVAFRLVDVASGGGDVAVAVACWAARRNISVRFVAVDRHATTAGLAREATRRHRGISVVRGDARALPFADRTFDVGLCTLALHHMRDEDAALVLRELHRVARRGFLAVDLVRGGVGHAAVWLLTRLSRSRVLRHDGPLSVRRARSIEEYRRLAESSGIPDLRVSPLPGFRVSLARLQDAGAAPR